MIKKLLLLPLVILFALAAGAVVACALVWAWFDVELEVTSAR